jgi:hypothetical protein
MYILSPPLILRPWREGKVAREVAFLTEGKEGGVLGRGEY